MNTSRALTLVLAAILIAGNAHADKPEDLNRFLSYPFMQRAYDAADREDWQEVESLTRYLLAEVPEQQDARGLLIQALVAQGRYDVALKETEKLSSSPENRQIRHQVQMELIRAGKADQQTVSAWLEDGQHPDHQQIWQAYSLQLQKEQGGDEALQWLSTVPGTESPALNRWRAVMAEQAGRSQIVVDNLEPLQRAGELSHSDWERLAVAYVNTQNIQGIESMLQSAPDANRAALLRERAAGKFIAANQPEVALRWLQPLAEESDADRAKLTTVLELARQTDRAALVDSLADRLDRPCLETAQWLADRDRERAARQLSECDPSTDPRRWMVLALRLDAIDLLASQPLSGEWERMRRSQLVDYWLVKGKTDKAIGWVKSLPTGNHSRRLYASLLEGDDHPGAAQAWLEYYARSSDPYALEQATFLLVQQGHINRAQSILERELKRHPERLTSLALERLATLYARQDSDFDLNAIELLLPRVEASSRAPLMMRLAVADHCQLVRTYVPADNRLAGDHLALAQCTDPEQPGIAAIYYRRAIEQGASGVEQDLAYALYAAGDSVTATEIWLLQDIEKLDQTDLLAASRSALQADRFDEARMFWNRTSGESTERYRLGADIALGAGQPERALELDHKALAIAPEARHYYAASASALAADQAETSLQWLAESVRRDPEHPVYRVEYGLRLAAHEDRDKRLAAIPYLENSVEGYSEDLPVVEALAYRYAEAGQSESARIWLRKAIELSGEEMFFARDETEQLVQRQYDQRRTHEVMERVDSFTLASVWSPSNVSGSLGQPASGNNYQVAIWDHLLARTPDGETWSVYGRALTSGEGRDHYFDTLGVGAGLRYKPFQQYNLNLYAELYNESSLEGETSRGTDLLLRASASLLDQGEYRNEWRPIEDQWSERLLFLDAAWFVREAERQFTARYRHGYAYKLPLSGAQTLMPYFMVQATALDERQDVRAGLGLRWQYWFADSFYNAYAKRLTFRVENQQGLGGNLYDQADGWLLGMEVTW